MSWLVLTLIALVSRALYGVIGKTMSRRLSLAAPSTSVVMLLSCAVIALPLLPIVGGFSTAGMHDHRGAVVLIVLSSAVGNIFYFKGLERLEVGMVQIAFSSIVAWGALLSTVFLGSAFSWLQLLGAAVLVIAILIAQYRDRLRPNKAVSYVLASAACFAVYQVASARVSDSVGIGAYLMLSYLGPAAIILGVYWRRCWADMQVLRSQASPSAVLATATTSTATISYYLAAYAAYRKAPDAGVVILLLSGQVVVAVLLGAVLLRERSYVGRKLGAAVLAVVAGVFIRS